MKQFVLVSGAGLILAAAPLLAHHSIKAQYDETMPIQLMGTVTKVVWNNPHVWLNVDVKDGGGKITTWQLELASPNGLIREGWKVDSLRRGDQITADGFPARDGSHSANIRKVTLKH